mmetsp:Transcript_17784/g.44474  ORF Transcript_17784/g.44474 Transcript_17784/m.44474 type:complete len:1395 (-) Transcript_17784:478-4662(-)
MQSVSKTVLLLLEMQSAQEKNPLRRAHYFFGTTRSFTERGTDQLIAQLQKHYESFYCPKNMRLVIVAPLPLQKMEDVAKDRFGSLDRECRESGSDEEASADPEAGAGPVAGPSAEGRCPAATEPAASRVGRYRPPVAVLQERGWGEPFPRHNLGKQFLVEKSERPEILILFPLRIFELDRKVDFYGLKWYLDDVFYDSGANSLQTVLRKESLVDSLSIHFRPCKAGSFLRMHLMLTDEADRNSERRALLWRTLFRWFQQLQGQTEEDLGKYIEKMKELKDVQFTWSERSLLDRPVFRANVFQDNFLRYEPREVLRGDRVISDVSACLVQVVLESLTASNMNYVYSTRQSGSAENSRTLPQFGLNYTESHIPPDVMQAASLTTGETTATALSVTLPGPLDADVVPSMTQDRHRVLDQGETPIAVLGNDLYFYAPQPNLEQVMQRLRFHLKDVDDFDFEASSSTALGSSPGGTAGTSCGRDVSLRCWMLAKIRQNIVSRRVAPLLNRFSRVGNTYRFEADVGRMEFEFLAFPFQIEELMETLVAVALDPLSPTTPGMHHPVSGQPARTRSRLEPRLWRNVQKIFSQEVHKMQNELENPHRVAGHSVMDYERLMTRQAVFSKQEKVRWLKQYTTPDAGAGQTNQRPEGNASGDTTFAGTNLDALWHEFEGYLSGEAEGRRRFRMTSLAVGNLDLKRAQSLERKMRELLTTTNRTTSTSSPSSARGLSLVDPSTTLGASKLALQDRFLRLENDRGKQIEMRVANPIPKDKSQHGTKVTWQFGTAENVEEEVLLRIIRPVAHTETHNFLSHKKAGWDIGGYMEHSMGLWTYSVYVVGDKYSPDQMVPLIAESNQRLREFLGNLTETATLHKARTLLKELRAPFDSVEVLYNTTVSELERDGGCFQRRRAMADYLENWLLPRIEQERNATNILDGLPEEQRRTQAGRFKQHTLAELLYPEADPDEVISLAYDDQAVAQDGGELAPEDGEESADLDAREDSTGLDEETRSPVPEKRLGIRRSGIQAMLVSIFDRFLNGPALTIKLFNSTSLHMIDQDPPKVILPGNKLVRPVSRETNSNSPCSAGDAFHQSEHEPATQTVSNAGDEPATADGMAAALKKPSALRCGLDNVCILRKVPDFEEKTSMLNDFDFEYWERSTTCGVLPGISGPGTWSMPSRSLPAIAKPASGPAAASASATPATREPQEEQPASVASKGPTPDEKRDEAKHWAERLTAETSIETVAAKLEEWVTIFATEAEFRYLCETELNKTATTCADRYCQKRDKKGKVYYGDQACMENHVRKYFLQQLLAEGTASQDEPCAPVVVSGGLVIPDFLESGQGLLRYKKVQSNGAGGWSNWKEMRKQLCHLRPEYRKDSSYMECVQDDAATTGTTSRHTCQPVYT